MTKFIKKISEFITKMTINEQRVIIPALVGLITILIFLLGKLILMYPGFILGLLFLFILYKMDKRNKDNPKNNLPSFDFNHLEYFMNIILNEFCHAGVLNLPQLFVYQIPEERFLPREQGSYFEEIKIIFSKKEAKDLENYDSSVLTNIAHTALNREIVDKGRGLLACKLTAVNHYQYNNSIVCSFAFSKLEPYINNHDDNSLQKNLDNDFK